MLFWQLACDSMIFNRNPHAPQIYLANSSTLFLPWSYFRISSEHLSFKKRFFVKLSANLSSFQLVRILWRDKNASSVSSGPGGDEKRSLDCELVPTFGKEDIVFCQGKRGGKSLRVAGIAYLIQGHYKNISYCCCAEIKLSKCPATGSFDHSTGQFVQKGRHSCQQWALPKIVEVTSEAIQFSTQ